MNFKITLRISLLKFMNSFPDEEPQEERPIRHHVCGPRVAGDGQEVGHLFQDGPERYFSTLKINICSTLGEGITYWPY